MSASDCVQVLVYHALQPCGTLAAHVKELLGIQISDAALAQRRARLPWEVFARLMELALRPLAQPTKHAHAFYKGLRLVGLDGTLFSLANTPRVLGCLSKAAARRFQAAFAKIGMCVLMELGVHNPLAAAIGRDGESESALGLRLLGQLPRRCLLIVDRLYGVGKWVDQMQRAGAAAEGHFLARVRGNLKAKVLEVLKDGSALVEVMYRDERRRKVRVTVREMRARVVGRHGKVTELRLWTSLLDAEEYPALELVRLYAQRWEQEIGYKELKVEMRDGELLASHTVETAAQELACLVLAQAALARMRVEAGTAAGAEVLRVSFAKLLWAVRALWWTLADAEGLLSARQEAALVRRTLRRIGEQLSAPRRARSCPRAVRQPVTGWPRLMKNESFNGEIKVTMTPIPRALS